MENFRRYNMIFFFTSMGGTVDHTHNNGRGPYVFRLHGQNCHLMGGLVPPNNESPIFSQLYIFDTTNEVANRVKAIWYVNFKNYIII